MVRSLTHRFGTFCYLESGSVDMALSQRFYAGLFGWGVDEHSFPSGGSYTRFLMQDLPVAGVFSVETALDPSMPSSQWWPFVSVESVPAVLEQAVALGAEPFGDVIEVPGSFSAVEFRDPVGALCGLWQAGAHIGSNFIDEPGALTWVDLITPDPSAAISFYGELFGWTVTSEGPESDQYHSFTADGAVVAGLARSDSTGTPWWRPHVGVRDFDAALAVAAELGGEVEAEAPTVSGLGRRASVRDPNGIGLMLVEVEP